MTQIPTIKPRVLIQTVTKPGYGLKEDRNKYEFEDANGHGLTPPSTIVAEDMRYSSSFDLNTIEEPTVRINLLRLDEETDEQLFAKMKNLAEWVSQGKLEANNINLIDTWRQQTLTNPQQYYTDDRLTDAVFDASVTQKFVNQIRKIVSRSISSASGNLDKASMKDVVYSNEKIKRPAFSSKIDIVNGLTFALNDTWGFRITLKSYSCDVKKRKYWAIVSIEIYDHFGLDKDDVIKYGSLEKIKSKYPMLLEILSQVTRPRNETLNAMTSYGKTDLILQEAADGFCAWFILQYRRGYKPFVTMMRKEIKIEGGF